MVSEATRGGIWGVSEGLGGLGGAPRRGERGRDHRCVLHSYFVTFCHFVSASQVSSCLSLVLYLLRVNARMRVKSLSLVVPASGDSSPPWGF